MQPCLNQSVDLDQLAKDIKNIHRETLLRINKNDFKTQQNMPKTRKL